MDLFKTNLFKPKAPKDDIRLADGAGFMVGQDRYHSHLKAATEIKEVGIIFIFMQKRTCHEYGAVNRVNLIQQHVI